MNRTAARNLIQLKTQVKMKEQWCEEHQCDIEMVCKMVEDLIALAVASTSSSQAYEQLQTAHKEFVKTIVDISEQYRHI
jgi:hypothetical protein